MSKRQAFGRHSLPRQPLPRHPGPASPIAALSQPSPARFILPLLSLTAASVLVLAMAARADERDLERHPAQKPAQAMVIAQADDPEQADDGEQDGAGQAEEAAPAPAAEPEPEPEPEAAPAPPSAAEDAPPAPPPPPAAGEAPGTPPAPPAASESESPPPQAREPETEPDETPPAAAEDAPPPPAETRERERGPERGERTREQRGDEREGDRQRDSERGQRRGDPQSPAEPQADRQPPGPAARDPEAAEPGAVMERRRARSEERRNKRQQEATTSDDAQTAIQTMEAIEPAGRPQVIEEDGVSVQRQTFRSRDGRQVETRMRPTRDGDRLVTTRITQPDGRVIERRRTLDRIDARDSRRWQRVERHRRGRDGRDVNVVIILPAGVDVAPERYVVDAYDAPYDLLAETLHAEPVRRLDRRYTVDEVTQSYEVRSLMPRIDLDTITFAFGSAAVPDDQLRDLDAIARALSATLERNPDEVFLLEGHTDAVGSELYNLQLSEMRALAVKYALVDAYGLPEDAFVTEGYGEEYLKVLTEEAERLNRRVTVRRITPLMAER